MAYPGKRPLLQTTARPPQLETPFAVFDAGAITPNDAFFVRYHLANSPPRAEQLDAEHFRLSVQGRVKAPLKLSVAELKALKDESKLRLARLVQLAADECEGERCGTDAALRFIDWLDPLLRRDTYLSLLVERPEVQRRLLRLLGLGKPRSEPWGSDFVVRRPFLLYYWNTMRLRQMHVCFLLL